MIRCLKSVGPTDNGFQISVNSAIRSSISACLHHVWRGRVRCVDFLEFVGDAEEVCDGAEVGNVEDGRCAVLFTAMTVSLPAIPATCWIAPEIPRAK